METVMMLLAVMGLAHFIGSHSGPFNVLGFIRNLIAKVPLLGSVWAQVIGCDFCLGGLAGAAVYLFTTGLSAWSLTDLVVWVLGAAMFNDMATQIMAKFTTTDTTNTPSA